MSFSAVHSSFPWITLLTLWGFSTLWHGSENAPPPVLMTFAPPDRLRLLSRLPNSTQKPLSQLHDALNGKSVATWLSAFDDAVEACEVRLKAPDKKRERYVFVYIMSTAW